MVRDRQLPSEQMLSLKMPAFKNILYEIVVHI